MPHHVSFGATAWSNHRHPSDPFAQGAPASASTASNGMTPGASTTSSSSSFGFGFGHNLAHPSSAVGAPSGFGFASRPPGSPSTSSYASQHVSASPSSLSTPQQHANVSPNKRRRRRSDSGGNDEMDEGGPDDEGGAVTARQIRDIAGGKRARKEAGGMIIGLHGRTSVNGHVSSATSAAHTNEIDLGKALASLSKPALLSVLTSLLAAQPTLKPTVLSLLPPPSLETFISILHSNEKKVLDALPVGNNLRDEYVWSRVRAPLEEYVAEVRLALSQFCPSPASPLSNREDADAHPTTLFAFLYTLTLSVRKMEVLLPRAPVPFASSSSSSLAQQQASASINNPSTLNPRDPLVSFLPPLFNQWHTLATRLSTLVNGNGRILSAETLRTWFRNLDELVNVPISCPGGAFGQQNALLANDLHNVGRKASEALRERFVRELGWLIGIRSVGPLPAQAMQTALGPYSGRIGQSALSVQGVPAQSDDSRMNVMMEDDQSDEEL